MHHYGKKKNNKGQNGQQNLSPERFIRERMRNVKIGKCYMTSDFDSEQGLGYVVITREHTGGRLSFAVYLIDKWCTGVKKTFFNLRVDNDVVGTLLEKLGTTTDLMEVGYNEAHNMVWGAVAFAEEAGIKPCKDFALTQYFLEDDTDDIPLIEYDYGHNGILVSEILRLHAEKLMPKMKQMYDLNLVDRQSNGYWNDVERIMERKEYNVHPCIMDIKEIYRGLESQFE